MQFQVPQFIEVEDKLFGPLTLKQFVYLAGGAAGVFLAYVFLPLLIAILVIPVIGGLSAALAFYKVNGRPFIYVMENAIKHFIKTRVYTWKTRKPKKGDQKKKQQTLDQPPEYTPKLTKSKLQDLAWSLDIKKGKDNQ